MAISKKQRTKGMESAQKLLPQARVTGYAIGRSGANPVVLVGALIGGFVGLSVIMLVLLGGFVFPGLIPLLILQHFMSPPRAVIVADQGVALATRSIWTGRANKAVSVMGFQHVQPVETSLGRVCVQVGDERIWLTTGEEAELRRSLGSQMGAFGPPA